MKHYQWLSVLISVVFSVLFASFAYGGEKTWSASGDGSSWSDDDNWYPTTEPTLSDDVSIDAEDAAVTCDETFKAKSITVGGRETSTLTSQNFIYGTVTPSSTSDTAILNRSGGTITLQGAGILTVKGKYIDLEGTLAEEPSFIFWIE